MLPASQRLIQIKEEYSKKIHQLSEQGVLNRIDLKKIDIYINESWKALVDVKQDTLFTAESKSKVNDSLIDYFENSLEKVIEDAIKRNNLFAYVEYKMSRLEKKYDIETRRLAFTNEQLRHLLLCRNTLRVFITKTLSSYGKKFRSEDYDTLLRDYEETYKQMIQTIADEK